MRQELFDFRLAHSTRMPLAMKQNEPADPLDIDILGSNRVMQNLQMLANLVEQIQFGALGKQVPSGRIHIRMMSTEPWKLGRNFRNRILASSLYA